MLRHGLRAWRPHNEASQLFKFAFQYQHTHTHTHTRRQEKKTARCWPQIHRRGEKTVTTVTPSTMSWWTACARSRDLQATHLFGGVLLVAAVTDDDVGALAPETRHDPLEAAVLAFEKPTEGKYDKGKCVQSIQNGTPWLRELLPITRYQWKPGIETTNKAGVLALIPFARTPLTPVFFLFPAGDNSREIVTSK